MAQFRREVRDWYGIELEGFGLTIQLELVRSVGQISEMDSGMAMLPGLIRLLEGNSGPARRIHQLTAEWYAGALVGEADLGRLRPILSLVPKPLAHDGFRQATGSDRGTPPEWCDNGWHMFTHLTTFNADPSGLLPCVTFVTFAVTARREAGDYDGAAVLDGWRLSSPPGEQTAMREAAHRNQLRSEPPATTARYLVVVVQPDASPLGEEESDAPARYLVKYSEHWRVDGEIHPQPGNTEEGVSEAELESKVGQIIYRSERDWQGDKAPPDLTVEFVLPLELLNSGVEWWQRPHEHGAPAEIVRFNPVVLRSFDRWRDRGARHRWQARWKQLQQSPQASRVMTGFPEGGDQVTRLEAEIQSDQQVVGLVLSAPPRSDPDTGTSDFEVAVRTGLPVIIWHRKDCALPAFREAVTELISDGAIHDLPGAVHKLRLAFLRAEPTDRPNLVGRHLALLWDDGDRGPDMIKRPSLGRSHA